MTYHQKATNEQLVNAYKKYASVWRVAEIFGMCGQSVHERLVKLGRINNIRIFSEQEKKELKIQYVGYRNNGKLQELADKMGRTKQYLCRKARELGLTDKNHNKTYLINYDKGPYFRQHRKVRKLRGNADRCVVCGEKNSKIWFEWANLTGKYEDPQDYAMMCRKCHRNHDKNRIMMAHFV